MALKPGIGRIIQLQKKIKELKASLEPFAWCSNPKGAWIGSSDISDCGECSGCRAKKVLEKK